MTVLPLLDERISTNFEVHRSIHFAQRDQRVLSYSYMDEWERNLRGNKAGWPAKSQGWQCKSLCQGASCLAAKLSKPLTLQYKKEHGAIFKLSSPLLHTPYLDDLFATFQSPSHHLKRSKNTLLVTPAALL